MKRYDSQIGNSEAEEAFLNREAWQNCDSDPRLLPTPASRPLSSLEQGPHINRRGSVIQRGAETRRVAQMKPLICALLLMFPAPLAAESWVLWVQIRITYHNNDGQTSRGSSKSRQEWRHMDGVTTKAQCLVTMRQLLTVLQGEPGKHVDSDSFYYHVYEPSSSKPSSVHSVVQGNFYCLPAGVDPKHLI